MALGKKELTELVAVELGSTKKDAGAAIDAVVSAIRTGLEKGEDVSLQGLVNFTVVEVPAHERVLGFDNGKTVQIPAKTKVKAKASKTLTK